MSDYFLLGDCFGTILSNKFGHFDKFEVIRAFTTVGQSIVGGHGRADTVDDLLDRLYNWLRITQLGYHDRNGALKAEPSVYAPVIDFDRQSILARYSI